mgnify:FL=1|tara:strand:+ start:12688 stop:13524 length:837 start_codon:yes stop_codon:yes gene_type:complete
MIIKNLKYKEIRRLHYKTQEKKFSAKTEIDITNWLKNPYTYLKSKYYIESSVLIVFLAQFTQISPNHLTFVYIILGILGGFFLAIENNFFIILSIIFFFTRGTFDWADGLLARIKNKTSDLGELLDNWGAIIGFYSFWAGLGYYLYNKHNEEIFIILSILIIFFKAVDLKNYSYHFAMFNLLREKDKRKYLKKIDFQGNKIIKKNNKTTYNYFKNYFLNFVDDRSRTIDLILFIIFLDNFYFDILLLKYIYYYFAFKVFIIFCVGNYVIISKKYLFKK